MKQPGMDRPKAIRQRKASIENVYLETIQDQIIASHSSLTEFIPPTEDFQLTINGLQLPPHAADMIENQILASIDHKSPAVSLRLGYDSIDEQLRLDGLAVPLLDDDGQVNIRRTDDPIDARYVLSHREKATSDHPSISTIPSEFVQEFTRRSGLSLPEKMTPLDYEAWKASMFGNHAITGWQLTQSAPLAFAIQDSQESSGAVTQMFTAHKSQTIQHNGDRFDASEMREVRHDITIGTPGLLPPITHRDSLIQTYQFSTTEVESTNSNFGIYYQYLNEDGETSLKPRSRDKAMLTHYARLLDALRHL